MVRLKVKRDNEEQFIFDTNLEQSTDDLITSLCEIYNGRLRIQRLCSEINELGAHGITLPPNMQGLADEQIEELKLIDNWAEKCVPSGGSVFKKDEVGKRNGQAPLDNMVKVLSDTTNEAQDKISKKNFQMNKPLTMDIVDEAFSILKGAVTIVYPMGLPPHDPISLEFNGDLDYLQGTQYSKDIILPEKAAVWFCGKEMPKGKRLSDVLGKNDKTTLIVKLTKSGQGPPAREAPISEDEQKKMMAYYYRKQEEAKKLAENEDDSYLNSAWADTKSLKNQLHGTTNLRYR